MQEKEGKKNKITKEEFVKEIIKLVLFSLFWIFLVNKVFSLNYVPTGSMQPTIKPGDVTVSFCGAYLFDEPEAGDIIIFEGYNGKTMVKRIIGTPNDKIQISNRKVYINGVEFKEEYLPESTGTSNWGREFYVVPEDCYFVMGDNRMGSSDSRFWIEPYVSKEDIKAKLLFVVRTSIVKEWFTKLVGG